MADPQHAHDTHAHDAHGDYVRGSQEISEQQATFHAFMGMSKWGSLAIAVAVAFLTVWFMPGGNLFAGLITAVVLAAAGWFLLKKPKSAH